MLEKPCVVYSSDMKVKIEGVGKMGAPIFGSPSTIMGFPGPFGLTLPLGSSFPGGDAEKTNGSALG